MARCPEGRSLSSPTGLLCQRRDSCPLLRQRVRRLIARRTASPGSSSGGSGFRASPRRPIYEQTPNDAGAPALRHGERGAGASAGDREATGRFPRRGLRWCRRTPLGRCAPREHPSVSNSTSRGITSRRSGEGPPKGSSGSGALGEGSPGREPSASLTGSERGLRRHRQRGRVAPDASTEAVLTVCPSAAIAIR